LTLEFSDVYLINSHQFDTKFKAHNTLNIKQIKLK